MRRGLGLTAAAGLWRLLLRATVLVPGDLVWLRAALLVPGEGGCLVACSTGEEESSMRPALCLGAVSAVRQLCVSAVSLGGPTLLTRFSVSLARLSVSLSLCLSVCTEWRGPYRGRRNRFAPTRSGILYTHDTGCRAVEADALDLIPKSDDPCLFDES